MIFIGVNWVTLRQNIKCPLNNILEKNENKQA